MLLDTTSQVNILAEQMGGLTRGQDTINKVLMEEKEEVSPDAATRDRSHRASTPHPSLSQSNRKQQVASSFSSHSSCSSNSGHRLPPAANRALGAYYTESLGSNHSQRNDYEESSEDDSTELIGEGARGNSNQECSTGENVRGMITGQFEGQLFNSQADVEGRNLQSTPKLYEGGYESSVRRKDPRGPSEDLHMELRSRNKNQQEGAAMSFPLRVAQMGQPQYIPFAHQDMEGLLNKLPPLAEGAEEWIGTIENETMGESLCAGDFESCTRET